MPGPDGIAPEGSWPKYRPFTATEGERRTAKAAAANTFRVIADELMAKHEREGRAGVTLNKNRWLLSLAYAEIGARPASEITAPELLAVLRKVERRGRYETAKRLRGLCGMVFRYAIATGRAERDPSVDLRAALTVHKVSHRATIVDPKGIGALLQAIEGFEGQPSTRIALRLAPTCSSVPASCVMPSGRSSISLLRSGAFQPRE